MVLTTPAEIESGVCNYSFACALSTVYPVGVETITNTRYHRFANFVNGLPQALWCALQVVLRQAHSKAADVYSFGMIMFECISFRMPWEDLNPFQVAKPAANCESYIPVVAADSSSHMLYVSHRLRCQVKDKPLPKHIIRLHHGVHVARLLCTGHGMLRDCHALFKSACLYQCMRQHSLHHRLYIRMQVLWLHVTAPASPEAYVGAMILGSFRQPHRMHFMCV